MMRLRLNSLATRSFDAGGRRLWKAGEREMIVAWGLFVVIR